MPIHPTAIVHSSAEVDETAQIGPYAHVGADSRIGAGCVLEMGAYVAANVVMGTNNTIGPYAVVGGDPQFLGFDKSLRSGVRIGNGNHLRELSTVHRSVYADKDTVLGDNNYLMVSTHVAHDCLLGNNIVMVNFSGIAGHVVVEDRVFISSHVGVQQFCRIGRVAMVGGATGINRDVPPYTTIKGNFGFIAGLNIVGMRRAGVDAAARTALRKAYKTVFRSGLSLKSGIAAVRSQWEGRDDFPAELKVFLDFLETPSKRGFLSARSHDRRRDEMPQGEDE
jgi:UDP-N-acetylglucosamine acyltransferase